MAVAGGQRGWDVQGLRPRERRRRVPAARGLRDLPIRSLAEFADHLEKALGLTASVEGISISPVEYRTEKLISGLDVQKAGTGPGGGAEFMGIDTSVGSRSNIRVEMRNVNAETDAQAIDRLTLVHNVVAVLDAGLERR